MIIGTNLFEEGLKSELERIRTNIVNLEQVIAHFAEWKEDTADKSKLALYVRMFDYLEEYYDCLLVIAARNNITITYRGGGENVGSN